MPIATNLLQTAVISAALIGVSGCGSPGFVRQQSPAITVQLTGVISQDSVSVSPSSVGAGPLVLTMANQSKQTETLTVTGEKTHLESRPALPNETTTIADTIAPGSYQVSARTADGTTKRPATLIIGPRRAPPTDITQP
jgi:hypothetical protein